MTSDLRFDGSLWCNLDIALRNIDSVFKRNLLPSGLSVIEWYILRELYRTDGQHASELARAVGRAATSFTPNLDKLQDKGFIERRPDAVDRRAVRIFLTEKAHQQRETVLQSAEDIDGMTRSLIDNGDLGAFDRALKKLQDVEVG